MATKQHHVHVTTRNTPIGKTLYASLVDFYTPLKALLTKLNCIIMNAIHHFKYIWRFVEYMIGSFY